MPRIARALGHERFSLPVTDNQCDASVDNPQLSMRECFMRVNFILNEMAVSARQ
jgi:hypothetical protein